MRVLLFGTFDILHDGHLDLFRQARRYGEELHVILARDSTIEQVKGRPTFYGEAERFKTLSKHVDTVYLGSLEDKYQAIRDIAPDTIVLGYDQKVFVDKLQEKLTGWRLPTRIVRGEPFHPEHFKSSLLREKLSRDILKGSS